MTLGYTCDLNVKLFCADLANYAAGAGPWPVCGPDAGVLTAAALPAGSPQGKIAELPTHRGRLPGRSVIP